MTDQRDDDALSWAGDDDPTLAPSGTTDAAARAEEASEEEPSEVRPVPSSVDVELPVAMAPETAAEREVTETAPPTRATVTNDDEAGVREQMSSTMLITLGIFGGVFLLYSVGWLISAFRPDAAVPSDTVGEFMFNLGQGLAVAAGPVWMAATIWLTRDSKPSVRIAMLALGVVLVLPWPFLRGV
ncbi:DNA polymerase III subunit gamma/tau [Plantibacter flavus]|uniref:DNA polymerase III subunit gamma/tau n=1 Tax=Plantibacter flavus TaxID=150123 RepID=UPI003F183ED1